MKEPPLRPDEMALVRQEKGRSIRLRRESFRRFNFSAATDPLGVMALEAAQEADLFMWCACHPKQSSRLLATARIRHGHFAYIGIDVFSGDQ